MSRKNVLPEFRKYPKSISLSFEMQNFIDQYIPCLSDFVSDKIKQEMSNVAQHTSSYAYQGMFNEIYSIYLNKRFHGAQAVKRLKDGAIVPSIAEKYNILDLDLNDLFADLNVKFNRELKAGTLKSMKRRA